MTRFFLAAGVATLAIAAPAASAPHGGHGQAQKQNGGHDQKVRGNAQAKVAVRAQASSHSQAQAKARVVAHSQPSHKAQVRTAQKTETRHQPQVRAVPTKEADRARDVRAKQVDRVREAQRNQAERARAVQQAEAQRIRNVRDAQADRIRDLRQRENVRVNVVQNVGYGGCPPGLAKKAVACMPPGQARKLVGARFAEARRLTAFERVPVRLRNIYRDTPDYYYQYGDGYMYRVNRTNDVVSALLPLFGAGYTVGQAFPSAYTNYALPAAYRPFYPASSPYDYRYANGYVYGVDPYTGVIANVDPMMGYGYGYGQMMPAAYSAYNVPYQYRPYYYDTSDYYYRYAPGAIYQVDPQTSLITGIAALLSGGMTVGQPMPVGYSAYNVPYGYRSNYYDTPNDWYRYANGNIYRVDPATQLVTALVASALT